MPIRLTDLLSAPSRGTTIAAIGYAVSQRAERVTFLTEYLTELYRLCVKYHFDFAILVAQSANETDKWRSAVWKQYGNPAGIGVTGTDTTSGPNLSLVYVNGKEAARAHVVHMFAYVVGVIPKNTELYDYIDLDPRYDAVFKAGYDGTITTIADFNVNGRWALLNKKPPYGDRIVTDGLAAWPGLPDQDDPPVEIPTTPEEPVDNLVFGKVPFPPHIKAYVYKRPGNGYTQASSPRNIVGMAFHEWMGVGSLEFHKTFFACTASGPCPPGYVCAAGGRCADALTDAFVMKDGTLVLMNDAWGTRIPWATGGGGPYRGDGAAFATRFGSGGFNSRLFSIEVVKHTGENYTEAQVQTLGALSAYVHDNDGQRWDEHPYTSKHGVVTDILHFEAAATSCGEGEIDDVTRVQAVAKQIMRSYQEQISVPDPIPPDVPEQPAPDLPGGAETSKASAAFGSLRRINTTTGAISTNLKFDPNGPISIESTRLAVAEFGLDYSKWPKWEDWYVLNDSGKNLQIVTFSNNWRLVKPDERAGWSLMDFAEQAEAA